MYPRVTMYRIGRAYYVPGLFSFINFSNPTGSAVEIADPYSSRRELSVHIRFTSGRTNIEVGTHVDCFPNNSAHNHAWHTRTTACSCSFYDTLSLSLRSMEWWGQQRSLVLMTPPTMPKTRATTLTTTTPIVKYCIYEYNIININHEYYYYLKQCY